MPTIVDGDLPMQYFDTPSDIISAVENAVIETDVVLDIGCGIVPMSYFRPKLHIMMEPWREYADILSYRHAGDKSVIVLRQNALDGLKSFADQSIDSISMLDVIEHMPKGVGLKVLEECERVARQQIIVFTTLGFMPQHVDLTIEKDGWGLNGAEVQEHLSGWMPGDFPQTYSFFICDQFHSVDFRGSKLPQPFGAFFAVCNLQEKSINFPESFSDIRRPLPVEIRFQTLEAQHHALQDQHQTLQEQHLTLQAQHETLQAQHLTLQAQHETLHAEHLTLLGSKMLRFSSKLKQMIGKPVSE
jgi:hypothetical protein